MSVTQQLTANSSSNINSIAANKVGLQNTLDSQEFLAFSLGAKEYGLQIEPVQEIRSYDHVKQIANTPAAFNGGNNLRGSIVPILDLRIKFSTDTVRHDQFTVVIVVKLAHLVIGMVVDAVSDVCRHLGCPHGVLLDIEKLMSAAEIGQIAKHAACGIKHH